MVDYRKFCNLESHLFNTVSRRFKRNKRLSAFDFFCIIIWKANRAKSKIAKRILNHDRTSRSNLDTKVQELKGGIVVREGCPKNQLAYLIEKWGFRLPMASAILTVLYPQDFTVYDKRVCDILGMDYNLQYRRKMNSIWDEYREYQEKVQRSAPHHLSLRDKDRHLWGKSFYGDLKEKIKNKFRR